MLMRLFIVLLMSWPVSAQAVTYYVSTSGIDSNDGLTTSTAWRKPQKCALPPVTAGDTCIIRTGTYTAADSGFTRFVMLISSTQGSASGTAGNPITIKSETPGGAVFVQPTDSTSAVAIYINRPFYVIDGIQVDGSTTTYEAGASISHSGIGVYKDDVIVRHVIMHHIARTVCSNSAFGQTGVFLNTGVQRVTVEDSLIYSIGRLRNGENGCSTTIGQNDHGVYIKEGTDLTIRGTAFYDINRGYPVNIYNTSTSVHTRYKLLNNTFAGRSPTGLPNGQIIIGGVWVDGQITNNLFYQVDTDRVINTFNLSASSSGNVVSYNRTNVNVTGADFMFGAATPTGFASSNNTENSTIGFKNASCTQSDGGCEASDFTLTDGSSAIDAGTDVGLSCNGPCDQGAHETFAFSAGTVTGTTAEVTLGMNLNTPVIPTALGWSLACTPAPTACPSPVITSTTLKTGTNSTVSITWSGGTCSTGQTWKVSYDPAVGGTTDAGPIVPYQELGTITNQTITNACTGSGPSLPGAPFLIYEFDDNLSDTSGNNLHITTSNGTSFVDARYFRGLKTDAGQDDYAEMPYFSGVNPATQSLTIAGGVYIDPADVCSLKAVGGTPAGVSQYFHLYYSSCTWKMIIQDSTATATEFSVQSGWNHVCATFNAATDTATLHINGVAGASSGSSLQTYTSFVFAGNFRIGRFSGSSLASGPNHIYDRWVVYQSAEDCGLIYENFNPPSTSYTGVINIVSGHIYMAKSRAGVPLELAPFNSFVALPKGAAFATAFQAHCTNAGDCSPVGQRPYYTCNQCPSAGSELPVPDTASSDGIEFWGTTNEVGLLTGAHGANLSGSETHVNGGTHLTSSSVTIVDLCQNCVTVERWIFRLTSAAPTDAQYCIFPKEQGGTSFDSYSPSPGMCVSVGQANANAGP